MFHFIIPLIKGRLIGLLINRLFPVVVRILRNQQVKRQNQNYCTHLASNQNMFSDCTQLKRRFCESQMHVYILRLCSSNCIHVT